MSSTLNARPAGSSQRHPQKEKKSTPRAPTNDKVVSDVHIYSRSSSSQASICGKTTTELFFQPSAEGKSEHFVKDILEKREIARRARDIAIIAEKTTASTPMKTSEEPYTAPEGQIWKPPKVHIQGRDVSSCKNKPGAFSTPRFL